MSLLLALALFQDPPPAVPGAWIGIRMVAEEGGVRLEAILPGTPGERVGLREGDVLRKFDGVEVKTLEDVHGVVKTKKPGDVLAIELERGGKRHAFRVVLARRPENPDVPAPPEPVPPPEFKSSAAEKAVHERLAKELVDRLGSDDFDVREAATESLVKLGPAVVPHLEGALKSDDAEVKARAETVVQRAPLQASGSGWGDVVRWRDDLDAALKEGRGVLAYFNDPGCGADAQLEEFVFGDAGVIEATARLACVKVTDDAVAAKHGVTVWPSVHLIDADGKKVDAFEGAPADAARRIGEHAAKFAAAAAVDLEAAKKSGKPVLVVALGPCEFTCAGRLHAALADKRAAGLVERFAVVRARAVESELTSYVAILGKDGKAIGEPIGGDVDVDGLVKRLKEAVGD